MHLSRTSALALALVPLLAACQAEEPVAPEPAATDVSGGELIAVPADEANPEGVTLPEVTMTPVAPSASASPAE
ncbi:hypothetical protein [Alteraurantiacibacter buctensis]|uniref:Uncharacterized protein n=1 Tax=Alteraurantiacibacter buctensis TaxID=1503981 RepID=A0A844YYH4_9SPHN|nr:hypothetical protein [Alteraurantiacibacter buctensis]MXO70783.1 hypothetical protein [Alteraurantiacibacter buctensis]